MIVLDDPENPPEISEHVREAVRKIVAEAIANGRAAVAYGVYHPPPASLMDKAAQSGDK